MQAVQAPGNWMSLQKPTSAMAGQVARLFLILYLAKHINE